MSTTSGSPARGTTVAFDGSTMYGSDYVLDISHKMRIPDKISFLPNSGEKQKKKEMEPEKVPTFEDYQWMHVPERIFVVGGEQHVSARDHLPELKLEAPLIENFKTEVTMPTPQKLTVEHPFPAVDADRDVSTAFEDAFSQRRKTSKAMSTGFGDEDFYNSFEQGSPPYDSHLNNSNYASGTVNEIVLLRKQMKMLNRRLTALERENHQRYQREIVMYSVGLIYFLLKGVFWFRRHW